MMRDPVAAQYPWHRRARLAVKRYVTRLARWKRWLQLLAMFSIAALALSMVALGRSNSANKRAGQEDRVRTQQLQDVICGVYVPIARAHLPQTSSPLGKTIVVATRHGALRLHCPGFRP